MEHLNRLDDFANIPVATKLDAYVADHDRGAIIESLGHLYGDVESAVENIVGDYVRPTNTAAANAELNKVRRCLLAIEQCVAELQEIKP